MLSLLVIVLPLAASVPQNYGPQYQHEARDKGAVVEFVDVHNHQNNIAPTQRVSQYLTVL